MKKIFLFLGMVIFGLTAFCQDIHFTKGDVAPGKLKNGADFEAFLVGNIRVKDAAGAEYSFVKAEFSVKSKEGKELKYTLAALNFSQVQTSALLDYSREGATYSFSGIVVKDKTGKEITLPAIQFIYNPYSKD